MSPSRGTSHSAAATVDLESSSEASTQARASIKSSSALASAKTNLSYLFAPDNPNSPRPAHRRTRALLRSLRYIGIFVFWRVVRYAKYALVGSIVAAVGATAFGGFVSGIGWIVAPPTIVGSLGLGTVWAMGKWGFRKMKIREKVGGAADYEVKEAREGVRKDGQWRDIQGPTAVPW